MDNEREKELTQHEQEELLFDELLMTAVQVHEEYDFLVPEEDRTAFFLDDEECQAFWAQKSVGIP